MSAKPQELYPAPALLEPIVVAASALLVAWDGFSTSGDRRFKLDFYSAWRGLERLLNPRRVAADDPFFWPSSSTGWPAAIRVVQGLNELSESLVSIAKKCDWSIGNAKEPHEPPTFDPSCIQSELFGGSVGVVPLSLHRLSDGDIAGIRTGIERLADAIVWAKANAPESWLPQAARAGGAAQQAVTPELAIEARVKIGDANVVILDGKPIAVKRDGYKLFELLLEAAGEYVSLANHSLRTRDVESLPEELRDTIESNPGAGTRIKREYLA